MSQINILIIVDSDKILKDFGSLKSPVELENPGDYIRMYDDETYDYYKSSKGKSELGSYASAGDLVTWTILPDNVDTNTDLKLVSIDDTTKYKDPAKEVRLFNNNDQPFIFFKSRRACVAISDNIKHQKNKEYYCYKVTFSIGDKEFWWDPFIPVRGEPDW